MHAEGALEAVAVTAETESAEAGQAGPAGVELLLESVGHRLGELDVLGRIDLELRPGERLAIVGPSGCGKSTLLELIAGLQEPSVGRVVVEGDSGADERLQRCAYMPQRDQLLPWLRAIDNAALGPRISGAARAEARERATGVFERLGLGGFERAWPGELSGGMRQRVAFARTLLTGKRLLLLDEPFAALDAITRADLQEWLLEALAADPRTVVLVTHDVEEALLLGDRIVVLSERPGRPLWQERPPVDRTRPRADVVTDPAFVAARERALRALARGRKKVPA
jgi:ABC-type nitrate/sulfonate/bicarbonate transport system ATPase subunit